MTTPRWRLDRLLNALGYIETRREAHRFMSHHDVTLAGEALSRKDVERTVDPAHVRINGDPLDPLPGLVLMLYKPEGYVTSHDDAGHRVFDLLPPRFLRRNPAVSAVGRLDKDTTGLLLFTDDGPLLHRLTSPKHHVPKVYDVTVADPLKGTEAEVFASGALMLRSEDTPLKPAQFTPTGPTAGRLVLHEGRYHQVKRMFASQGNRVVSLHRASFGPLTLGDLPSGAWRLLTAAEVGGLLATPKGREGLAAQHP
jgi:16S rRNA pseudouridine516 synthase